MGGSRNFKVGHLPIPWLLVTATTPSTISLSWGLGRNYSRFSSYSLEFSTDNENWTPEYSGTNTTYVDQNLSGDTPYYYRIRMQDTRGNYSEYRTASARTRTNDVTAPSVPQITVSASSTAFTVSWTAATDNIGLHPTTPYECTKSADGGATWAPAYSGVGTGFSETAPVGTTRHYRVRSQDSSGNYSGFSQANATVQAQSANLLLFDDFNYVVLDSAGAQYTSYNSPFCTIGPWTAAKGVNITGSSVGHIFTVSQQDMRGTTGYAGQFPNPNSRILKMVKPQQGGQTSFHLQCGGYANAIPANVWFQYWIYTNRYGTELSGTTSGKFLYPTNNDFPSSTNKWLHSLSAWAASPQYGGNPYGNPTAGEMWIIDAAQMGSQPIYNNDTDIGNSLGPNMVPREQAILLPNRWYCCKVHYDHSVANRGTFEMWIKQIGQSWVKTHEWIGGVTPNFVWGGFTPGGHRDMQMPTTWPGNVGNMSIDIGKWVYMQDFAMASAEAALPTYAL